MSTNDNRLNSEKALRLLKYKYEFPSQEGANNVKIVLRKLELDSKSYAAFVAPTGSKFYSIRANLLIWTMF